MWEKKQVAHSTNSMMSYQNHSNTLWCFPVVRELGEKTVQAGRVLLHLLPFPFSGGTWCPWPWPTHPQTSVNTLSSFRPSNKVSTGVKPPNPHPQPFLHSKVWYWHFLNIFFPCEKLLIAFHLVSLLWSPHLNTTLIQSSPGWMSSQY